MTDVAKLAPRLPNASNEALALVKRSGRFLADCAELASKLRAVPSAKVLAVLRSALRAGGTDEDRVRAVADVVESAGLQAPPPIEPLPRVAPDQVRLVCWMAVRGAAT